MLHHVAGRGNTSVDLISELLQALHLSQAPPSIGSKRGPGNFRGLRKGFCERRASGHKTTPLAHTDVERPKQDAESRATRSGGGSRAHATALELQLRTHDA